jgi:hypothetical protein
MTEMARTNRKTNQAAFAGLALAAALIVGIVGGVVGALIAGSGPQTAVLAQGAQIAPDAALDPKWVEYGRNWERQYRAMYPVALDPKWVEYGRNWERQYRAMSGRP